MPRFTAPPEVPAEFKRLAHQWRQVKVMQTPGPDNIILAASLTPTARNNSIASVYSIVTSTAYMMLLQLSMGSDDHTDTLPLRGGIDSALGGFYAPDNELYSPALVKAYELESKTANVPRVVVGTQFQQYVRSMAMLTPENLSEAYTKAVAEEIVQCLIPDGTEVMVDFMGDIMRRSLDRDLAREIASKAWSFINAMLSASSDARVVEKYEWLRQYVRPRLADWGMIP